MVSAPATPVSDYTDTKSVFLLQILTEKSCTTSETETNTDTENLFFYFLLLHIIFYSKTKQDIEKCFESEPI